MARVDGDYNYPKFSDKYSLGTKIYSMELQWDGRTNSDHGMGIFSGMF